jgi:hypothetical protein
VIKSAHNSDIGSLSEVEKNTFWDEKGIQQKKTPDGFLEEQINRIFLKVCGPNI